MEQGGIERRRGRRMALEAPLLIRRMGDEASQTLQEATKNVGLAGVYFETHAGNPYTVNEVVMTSVAVPEPQRRFFPFTRLTGRGRVVRVTELPPQSPAGPIQYGVALEFGDDLTALTALPVWG